MADEPQGHIKPLEHINKPFARWEAREHSGSIWRAIAARSGCGPQHQTMQPPTSALPPKADITE
jgi:hypothetical protein